jgi:hypothetical protein
MGQGGLFPHPPSEISSVFYFFSSFRPFVKPSPQYTAILHNIHYFFVYLNKFQFFITVALFYFFLNLFFLSCFLSFFLLLFSLRHCSTSPGVGHQPRLLEKSRTPGTLQHLTYLPSGHPPTGDRIGPDVDGGPDHDDDDGGGCRVTAMGHAVSNSGARVAATIYAITKCYATTGSPSYTFCFSLYILFPPKTHTRTPSPPLLLPPLFPVCREFRFFFVFLQP